MRLLTIVNAEGSPAGVIEDVARAEGVACEALIACRGEGSNASLGDPIPESIDGYDGLVVLGGHMSVNDRDDWPFIGATEDLMREAAEKGVPVLGVCLGAQLLASAHGAAVTKMPATEYGFTEIHFLPATAEDPVLGHAPKALHLMQWHDDTFALPPGATLFGHSAGCAHQGFRVGETSWGTQFHFEVTPDIVRHWATLRARGLEQDEAASVAEIDRQVEAHYTAHRHFAEELTRRYLGVVKRQRVHRTG